MDRTLLNADLDRDEGKKYKPYVDTKGKISIGTGRNLTDVGIFENERVLMRDNNVSIAVGDLDAHASWWHDLPEPVARGLCNMCFNMGWPRLAGFKLMLAALQSGNYDEAAAQALDSDWANDVGDRAKRIAELFKMGAP